MEIKECYGHSNIYKSEYFLEFTEKSRLDVYMFFLYEGLVF